MKQTKNSKPEKVVLWGIGEFTQEYIKYLEKASITPIAVVDKYKHGCQFCGMEVLSPENLSKFLQYPVIPTGRRTLDDSSRFLDICLSISNYYKFDGIKILHPCFLVDYLKLDYKKKPNIIGFPGSGNQLLTTILKNIFEDITPNPNTPNPNNRACENLPYPTACQNSSYQNRNSQEAFFNKLSQEHISDLKKVFDNILYIYMDGTASQIYPTSLNYGTYEAQVIGGAIKIDSLVSKFHIASIYQSHEPLTQNLIDTSNNLNLEIFFSVRHPFDIIVSNAFKVNELFDSGLEQIDHDLFVELSKSNSVLREQWGLLRLNNMNWFEKNVLDMKNYFESYLKYKNHVATVKYEDLINEPHQTIKNISNVLEKPYSDSQIEKLWKEVGFKPVSGPGHFFRPGAEKWKKYFSEQHINFMKKLHYDEILSELGYSYELKQNPLKQELKEIDPLKQGLKQIDPLKQGLKQIDLLKQGLKQNPLKQELKERYLSSNFVKNIIDSGSYIFH